jgi:hypothetical protein
MTVLPKTEVVAQWDVEAFVEYDQNHLYNGPEATLAPFGGIINDAIPFTCFLRLREGFDLGLLSFIISIGSTAANPPPENLSVWVEQALMSLPDGADILFVGSIDFDQLQLARSSRNLAIDELNLATRLLWDTMAFIGGELGESRVRLVLRVSQKRLT